MRLSISLAVCLYGPMQAKKGQYAAPWCHQRMDELSLLASNDLNAEANMSHNSAVIILEKRPAREYNFYGLVHYILPKMLIVVFNASCD